jgi:hypothetical protein
VAIDRLATVKRAEGFVQAGQFESAIDEYARVFEEYPDDWSVANTLGDLHLRAGQKNRAAELFLQIGEAFHRQGFVPKAVALYKKALKARPGDEHALARLAMVAVHQELFADARLYLGQLLQQLRQRGDGAGVAECEARLAGLPDRRAPTQSGKTPPAAPPAAALPPLRDEVSTARGTLPSTMPLPAASSTVAASAPATTPDGFTTGAASPATGATVSDAAAPDGEASDAAVLAAAACHPAASDSAAPSSGAAAASVAAGSQPIASAAGPAPAARPTAPPAVGSIERPAAAARGAAAAMGDSSNETAVAAVDSAAVPAPVASPGSYVLERFGEQQPPDHLDPAPILVPVTVPRTVPQPIDAEPVEARHVSGPAGGQGVYDAPAIVEIVELGDLLDQAETDTAPAVLPPALQVVTVPVAPVAASTTGTDPADRSASAMFTTPGPPAAPAPAPAPLVTGASAPDAGFADPSQARDDAPSETPAPAAVLAPARMPGEPDRSAGVATAAADLDRSSPLAHSIAELEAAAASPAFEFRAAAELGRLWIRQGDLPQAARWLERAGDVPAPVPEQGVSVRYDLGDTLERMNAVERALDVFRNIAMDAGDYRDVRTRISRLEARAASGSPT